MATSLYAFGTVRAGSRASSARFETVSTPVYASIATGIEIARLDHVGATPQWTFPVNVSGLKTSTNPRITSSTWVAKSTTASVIDSLAASVTPTTLSPTRTTITIAPTTMSQGLVRSGSQKIER
jgi:hypothetical protein